MHSPVRFHNRPPLAGDQLTAFQTFVAGQQRLAPASNERSQKPTFLERINRMAAAPVDGIYAALQKAKQATEEGKQFHLFGKTFDGPTALTIGVLKGKDGKISGPKVMARLLGREFSSYQGQRGNEELLKQVQKLFFDDDLAPLPAVQTLGGTNALSTALRLANKIYGEKRPVCIANAFWGNYKSMADDNENPVQTYPYVTKDLNCDFRRSLAFFERQEPSIIFIQRHCHNPIGIDPTHEDIKALLTIAKEKGHLVIFDEAYTGLVNGEADFKSMKELASIGVPFIIAAGNSKNMGLYGNRVGSMLVVGHFTEDQQQKIQKELNNLVRASISSTPVKPADAAATLLKDHKQAFFKDLRHTSARLTRYRRRTIKAFNKYAATLSPENRKQVLQQIDANRNGMFMAFKMSKYELHKMQEHGIFGVNMSCVVDGESVNFLRVKMPENKVQAKHLGMALAKTYSESQLAEKGALLFRSM